MNHPNPRTLDLITATSTSTCPRCGEPRTDGTDHDSRRCREIFHVYAAIVDAHILDAGKWLRDHPVGECSHQIRKVRQEKLRLLASWLRQAGYIAEPEQHNQP